MRRHVLVAVLCLGLAGTPLAQTATPQGLGSPEDEAKALVLAAGLRDQLLRGMPAMADGLRRHMEQRNPGREADIARAVETEILPAVTERLDELIALGVDPLVRGFTAEELFIMRRFLELELDRRMEGALRMVAFELDRDSGEWLRRVAQEALTGPGSDARLRDLKF
jgi:hypothetical protein